MNKDNLKKFYFKLDKFLRENILVLLLLFVVLLRINFTSIKFSLPSNKVYNTAIKKYKFNSNREPMLNSVAVAETTDAKYMDFSNSMQQKTAVGSSYSVINKKIVKSSNLSIEISDSNNIRTKLDKDIEKVDGFIENYYSYDFYGKTAFNFTIKIPTEKLTLFLDKIKQYGELKSENFSLIDKTEQYNDNQNRLKNLYIRRESLRKMMTTKTAKLSDILAVDKELNDVQYEIEKFEKHNTVIDKEAKYSNVNLTLIPEIINQEKIEKWKITVSFKLALLLLLKVLKKIANLIIVLIVFSPLILICYWIYKKIINK